MSDLFLRIFIADTMNFRITMSDVCSWVAPLSLLKRNLTLNTLLRNAHTFLLARFLGSSAKLVNETREQKRVLGSIQALVITLWFCDPFTAHRYRLGSFGPIDSPSEDPSMPLAKLSAVLPYIYHFLQAVVSHCMKPFFFLC